MQIFNFGLLRPYTNPRLISYAGSVSPTFFFKRTLITCLNRKKRKNVTKLKALSHMATVLPSTGKKPLYRKEPPYFRLRG